MNSCILTDMGLSTTTESSNLSVKRSWVGAIMVIQTFGWDCQRFLTAGLACNRVVDTILQFATAIVVRHQRR
jgi:hypothetical protein